MNVIAYVIAYSLFHWMFGTLGGRLTPPPRHDLRLQAKDIGDEEWWLAKNATGQTGMIPLDYVEIKFV